MGPALAALLALACALARAGDPPKPEAPAPAAPPEGEAQKEPPPPKRAEAPEQPAPPPPAPEPAPDPPSSPDGRTWRRITGVPEGLQTPPTCDPARGVFWGCPVLDPNAPRPQGGYYYGLILGPDGKLLYVKIYQPGYGDSKEPPHNDPPPASGTNPLPQVQRDPPEPKILE